MKRIQVRFVLAALVASVSWAQAPRIVPPVAPFPAVPIEQPDAGRTQQELSNLLQRYPPTLREVFAVDPSLLSNQSYLAPYPALAGFLNAHPEIALNPSFYVGASNILREDREPGTARIWEEIVTDVSVFSGFALAFCIIAWLIRALMDYRRWARLTKIQTDVHTKLLDRFTSNEDLLAYIQSPAGSKFLESSPITLDAGPRNVAAPMGRILWTAQGGVVLVALGIGLQAVSGRLPNEASQVLHALGILGMALGIGFLISALISYFISRRLGLIERPESSTT